jgi:peptidoglycan/LPS O-acetylase OafA/YrhL
MVRIGGEFLVGCWLYRAFDAGFLERLPWGPIGILFALIGVGMSPRSGALSAASFVVLVYALAWDVAILKKVFANRVTTFLGEISYSIYLLHWFVIVDLDALLNAQFGDSSSLDASRDGPWVVDTDLSSHRAADTVLA